jgi:hypothetical protein
MEIDRHQRHERDEPEALASAADAAPWWGWWRRSSKQEWKRVCGASSLSECWDVLLGLKLQQGGRQVLAKGVDPNRTRKPR